MVCEIIGKNNAIVVAHPDDETLWAGGLPIRFSDRSWTIICCSIPRTDPIRAWKFYDACAVLGATGKVLPIIEPDPNLPLAFFSDGFKTLGLQVFDCVVTHNAQGEYGHLHHKLVGKYIASVCKNVLRFGYRPDGRGKYLLELTEKELSRKMAALLCYNHKLPFRGEVMTKSKALLQNYKLNMGVETYD